jgi:hypothetical protein
MARNDRTIRLEVVKRALTTSRRGVALKVLADKHGYKLRNLYRDIDTLEAAHFPIIKEEAQSDVVGSDGIRRPHVRLLDQQLKILFGTVLARRMGYSAHDAETGDLDEYWTFHESADYVRNHAARYKAAPPATVLPLNLTRRGHLLAVN